jgi:hypothetical protein
LRGEYDKAIKQYEKVLPLLESTSQRAEYVRSQIEELSEFTRHSRTRH